MKTFPSSDAYPLIYHYLKKYQENPDSRVFAPLAEAYRKAGLLNEALEVAQEGVRKHSQFIGGRVALARILFDQMLYEDVIAELSVILEDIPDNLVAQRLLAESNLVLGRTTEALSAYKMLLYFSPQDLETARIVQELEAQVYEGNSLVLPAREQDKSLRLAGDPLEFNILPVQMALGGDPTHQKNEKVRKIEKLQGFLQSIERYRHRVYVKLESEEQALSP